MIIQTVVEKVLNHLHGYYTWNEVEEAKLKYSLEVLFSEVSKISILLLFFSLFKMQWDAFLCIVTLSILRSFSGGLHLKTYSTCLLFTGFFVGVTITFQYLVPINFNVFTGIFLFTTVVILSLAPIISKKRPNMSKEKRIKFKITSLLIQLSYFILYLTTKDSKLTTIAIWVAVFQSIQLIIAKGVQYYEKRIQKNN